MPDVILVPTAEIAADALTRDRARLDPDALLELKHSILATGLRMPVELFALPEPDPHDHHPPPPLRPHLGFRRLAAVRALAS